MNLTAEQATKQQADTVPHADEPHTGPIKTPRDLVITVVLAFVLPVVIIFLLITLVVSNMTRGAGSGALTPEAIATRIRPVANFVLVDAFAPKVFKTGQQVYDTTCTTCHAAGLADAPRLGDATAWGPLINQGLGAMLKVALEGKGAMPARGGNPSLSDFEIERAIVYMANQSGGNLPEPEEPAAPEAP